MELHELMGKLHKLELVQQLAHRRGAQEHGLYFGQMPVLDFIAANPGCTQVQVADHLRVSPASIALSTKRLQKAGYLTKEVDAENLRCKRLYISEEGQRACAMCRERLDQIDAVAFQGFSEEELLAGKCQTLDEILPEVLAEVKPFEAQFGHDIPVFVAGGVYTGEDIAHYTKMGAAGAQLATRFIPTYECDASQTYKDVLLAANPEDVRIIHSPVGMPGRALATPLVQKLEQGLRFPPKHCARCLKACEPAKVPYCITHALIEAVKGNVEEGLFFCGANVGRLDRMRSVRELMDELMDDWRKHQ